MTRLSLLAIVLAFAVPPTEAQGLLGRARRAAQRGVEQAVDREAERRADQAATDAIDGAVGAPTSAPAPDPVDPAGGPAVAAALVNYDFVPGEHVLFADDFTAETLGDFPRRLAFVSGNMETAEWQGRRWLRATSWAEFAIELPEALPERFTFEFEAAIPHGASQDLYFSDDPTHHVGLSLYESGVESRNRSAARPSALPQPDAPFPVKVMADGDYVKVYVNGTRVANVPNAALGRSRRVRFVVKAEQGKPAYFGDFRLAEGGRDLPAVAAAVVEAAPEAPLVLTGVVFDTGRATLRPESGPVLDAVAASLAAHPEVRVRVEGHTDATGSAETNRTLSQARAEAVAATLAAKGVAADRLEAQGFGPDQPVADNATPEGRQQNRRVALARL
ncbi:OmpA family protein [Rubrivirga marina]|uniref:OmpA-like domain-containing protein n=1 Tax=Rubrivirga marina TaxID=1196024 RepID=A0A271IVB0_9BACT|nr:OmpA family protein [Rubrivirga marina]PAP75057.1 hypothetical protein BSZ37_00620 [Rubrivirga marina]